MNIYASTQARTAGHEVAATKVDETGTAHSAAVVRNLCLSRSSCGTAAAITKYAPSSTARTSGTHQCSCQ
jgi:cytidine deaminase